MENLGTSLRTYENMMGTQMFKKKIYAHTPSSPQGKELNLLYLHVCHLNGCSHSFA
jgi:hypothetical protein